MPAIKRKHVKDFTIVSNALLTDKTLPNVAKGLLMTMLSLPSDWHYSIAGLQAICADGQDRISSTLKTLEEHGYLRRVKKTGEKGTISKWEYYFSDEPIFLDPKVDPTCFDSAEQSAADVSPSVDAPSMENPDVETVPIYKELKDKELIDKELKEKNMCCTAAQHAAEQASIALVVEVSKKPPAAVNKAKKSVDKAIYAAIIERLNEKAGTNYKPTTKETQKHINARLNEGYTLDDFKAVIDRKCSEWLGTHMAEYLRPQTLFGTKFESYLTAPVSNNQKPAWSKPSEPEQPRDYSTNMMDLLDRYLGE